MHTSKWELHVYERVAFSEKKNTIQRGKALDLGAEPPCVKLGQVPYPSLRLTESLLVAV